MNDELERPTLSTFDRERGLLYTALGEEPAARSLRTTAEIVIDYDADGKVIGVEVFLPEDARGSG